MRAELLAGAEWSNVTRDGPSPQQSQDRQIIARHCIDKVIALLCEEACAGRRVCKDLLTCDRGASRLDQIGLLYGARVGRKVVLEGIAMCPCFKGFMQRARDGYW